MPAYQLNFPVSVWVVADDLKEANELAKSTKNWDEWEIEGDIVHTDTEEE